MIHMIFHQFIWIYSIWSFMHLKAQCKWIRSNLDLIELALYDYTPK